MTYLLATVLILYLVALLALSLYANRRVQDEEDYLVAGRRLPLWLAWGTLLATWFGAATVLGAAEAARVEGLRGTILDPFASGVALVLAGLFFARPLWEMRLLTLADFYGRKFGPRAEVLASIIMIPGYFGWIAAQFIALAGIQETFFGIPPSIGIFIACGVVLTYTMIGGMWSVTLTDTLQIVVVLITLLILAVATLNQLGGGIFGGCERLFEETPSDMLTLLPVAGTAAWVAWTATWANGALGNIPGQDLMQRVFAAQDATTARRACIIAGAVYIGFGLLPVMLGLASRILLPEDQDGDILAVLASQFLTPVLSVVFVVSLVSIIISTCTSAVLSPAAVLGHNLLGRMRVFHKRGLLVDRLSVLLVATAGVATAFSGKTILELLELSLSITFVSLFVPLVMGLYGRQTKRELPALLAMAFGFVVWLPREFFEIAVLPMPDDAAGSYPDFVFESMKDRQWPAPMCSVVFGCVLLPSAISGVIASLLGYSLGQKLTVRD